MSNQEEVAKARERLAKIPKANRPLVTTDNVSRAQHLAAIRKKT